MKDWLYYSKPNHLSYFGWEEQKAYKASLLAEINETPMTAAERKEALAAVRCRVNQHATEQNRPYRTAEAALEREFWLDARAELGYDKFLTPEGVAALEAKAWDDGHSSGFSEVFFCLGDLTDFCHRIVASAGDYADDARENRCAKPTPVRVRVISPYVQQARARGRPQDKEKRQ